MLSEGDRRVLNAVFPTFLESFNYCEAAVYMELSGIFTSNETHHIEEQKSSLSGLKEFYRFYSRKADGLEKLIGYLETALQKNLIDVLENYRWFKDGTGDHLWGCSSMTRAERHRVLIKGQVPFPRKFVDRSDLRTRLISSLSTKDEYANGFFVVLHGIAGSGKTSLATHILSETNIVGSSFDHVCFLTDGRTNPVDIKILFYDLMVMLRDDLLTPPPIDISDIALRKMILDALIDYPNLLVVLDDVTSIETIREAERLGLRVLATTRDRSIFDVVDSPVEVISVDGLTINETHDLMKKNGFVVEDGCTKVKTAIALAREVTSGNPAMLLKMAKMAKGSHATLYNLSRKVAENGVSIVDCNSSYRHRNLHETLSKSVMLLPEWGRNALACAVVMPSEKWIPLDVWASVVPVDIFEADDLHDELRRQLRTLSENGGWVTESPDHDSFKVSSMVINYLKETVLPETIKEIQYRFESAFETAKSVAGTLDDRKNAFYSLFLATPPFLRSLTTKFRGTPV